MKIPVGVCSAELHSAVSRICNPPSFANATRPAHAAAFRMQFGDTAECNSALRGGVHTHAAHPHTFYSQSSSNNLNQTKP
jgi:hypothetical protein